MKFSIVHPSRERCQLAKQAAIHWIGNFSNDNELEYIVSIDHDDQQKYCYEQWCEELGIQLITNQNRSLVDASNKGAALSTGECIVLVSDDFNCPLNWDQSLKDKIQDKTMYGILINDDISKGAIMSLPIISRTLFDRLGYIYHPNFFSLWADNALLDVVKLLDCLIDAQDLVFRHQHYSVGRSKKDTTYERENSASAYNLGKLAYQKLKERNYDL